MIRHKGEKSATDFSQQQNLFCTNWGISEVADATKEARRGKEGGEGGEYGLHAADPQPQTVDTSMQ